jgi:hypothetical protein
MSCVCVAPANRGYLRSKTLRLVSNSTAVPQVCMLLQLPYRHYGSDTLSQLSPLSGSEDFARVKPNWSFV